MENKIKKYSILKIIITILYFGITAFLLGAFIDSFNASGENVQLGIALTYAIVVVLFGAMGYGALLITSIIGLILSAVGLKREKTTKKTMIYFIVFTALTIITYLLMVFVMPIFINQ